MMESMKKQTHQLRHFRKRNAFFLCEQRTLTILQPTDLPQGQLSILLGLEEKMWASSQLEQRHFSVFLCLFFLLYGEHSWATGKAGAFLPIVQSLSCDIKTCPLVFPSDILFSSFFFFLLSCSSFIFCFCIFFLLLLVLLLHGDVLLESFGCSRSTDMMLPRVFRWWVLGSDTDHPTFVIFFIILFILFFSLFFLVFIF